MLSILLPLEAFRLQLVGVLCRDLGPEVGLGKSPAMLA
jgi:hypothetical protein